MADTTSSQIYDGARNVVVKFTDVSDGTGLSGATFLDVSTLTPNPGVHLKLRRLQYGIEGMSIRLQWAGTPNADIVLLSNGESVLDFSRDFSGGIPNNASSPTGNVLISTINATAGGNLTIFAEFYKGVQLI